MTLNLIVFYCAWISTIPAKVLQQQALSLIARLEKQ
jgi:hypothetical protein